MLSRVVFASLYAMISMGFVFTLHAQERAAAGPIETQVTWTALSNQIADLRTQVQGATTSINQQVTCGKKKMIYAPGVAGIDGDGCIAAASGNTIVQVSQSLKARWAGITVACPTGYTLTGGGGACMAGGPDGALYMNYNRPYGNGWHAACDGSQTPGTAVAYAICMKN